MSGGARSADADVARWTLCTEVSRPAAVADRASAETTTISEMRTATKRLTLCLGRTGTARAANRGGLALPPSARGGCGPPRATSLFRGTGPVARCADLDRTVALTPFAALFLTVAELGVVVIAMLGKGQFGFRRSQ